MAQPVSCCLSSITGSRDLEIRFGTGESLPNAHSLRARFSSGSKSVSPQSLALQLTFKSLDSSGSKFHSLSAGPALRSESSRTFSTHVAYSMLVSHLPNSRYTVSPSRLDLDPIYTHGGHKRCCVRLSRSRTLCDRTYPPLYSNSFLVFRYKLPLLNSNYTDFPGGSIIVMELDFRLWQASGTIQ